MMNGMVICSTRVIKQKGMYRLVQCAFQVIPLQGRPYLEADDDVDNAVCGLLNVHFVIEETSSPGLLTNTVSYLYLFFVCHFVIFIHTFRVKSTLRFIADLKRAPSM